jgi:DNA-binding IscR family transcriptional regulator
MLKWYLVWAFIHGPSGAIQLPSEAACMELLTVYQAIHGNKVVASCQQGIRHG